MQDVARRSKHRKKLLTTRHMAALDFLKNIPMGKELHIVERGVNTAKRAHLFSLDSLNDGGENDDDIDQDIMLYNQLLLKQRLQLHGEQGRQEDNNNNSQQPGNNGSDNVGRKLEGPATLTLRYPQRLRYILSQIAPQAAVIKQWENNVLSGSNSNHSSNTNGTHTNNRSLYNSRMFCSRARAYPTAIFSIIGYDAGREKARTDQKAQEDRKGIEVFHMEKRDWRGLSYIRLFLPIIPEEEYAYDQGYMHDPNSIDDPSMLHGDHKYTAQRSIVTGPILSSITLFVNDNDLKTTLNEQFREMHPHLPPSLSLSKIRNLKRRTLLKCLSLRMEVSTVALAVISFERMVIKGLVTKYNRKLTMAVCLVLSYKMNEPVFMGGTAYTGGIPEGYDEDANMANNTSPSHMQDSTHISSDIHHQENRDGQKTIFPASIDSLFDFIDSEWGLSKKQVLDAEFGCFVHLNFSLHVPANHLFIVCMRLLKLVNLTPRMYLGESMLDTYQQDMIMIERSKGEVRKKERLLEKEEEERERLERREREEEEEEEKGRKKRERRRRKEGKEKKAEDGDMSSVGHRSQSNDAKQESTYDDDDEEEEEEEEEEEGEEEEEKKSRGKKKRHKSRDKDKKTEKEKEQVAIPRRRIVSYNDLTSLSKR